MGDRDRRPMKITNQNHPYSLSSSDRSLEKILRNDLHAKTAMMERMFSSTHYVSILGLRGDKHDDPDLHPVFFPDDPVHFIKTEGPDREGADDSYLMESASTDFIHSPINSSVSFSLLLKELHELDGSKNPIVPQHSTTVAKIVRADFKLPGEPIQVVDIDATYRPPAGRLPKPS